jgi:hypothetical protein
VVQLVDAVGKRYDFVVSGDPRSFVDLVTPAGLRWVYRYVVAVNKDLIVPRDATGRLKSPTTLVADAHRIGLGMHAWRFANENTFLPADYRRGTDPLAWATTGPSTGCSTGSASTACSPTSPTRPDRAQTFDAILAASCGYDGNLPPRSRQLAGHQHRRGFAGAAPRHRHADTTVPVVVYAPGVADLLKLQPH